MEIRKFCYLLSLFLCLFFGQSTIQAQTPAPIPTETPNNRENKVETNQPPQQQEDDLTLIHLGDLIEVDVIGSFEFDWRGTLNPEGFLNGINFVEEPVFGLCRSESDVAADVIKGYSKILRDPKVEVRILDRSNRAISVLDGAVKTPHRFQIGRTVLLNELLIISGGLTDKASGEIQIYRPQNLSCAAKNTATAAANNGGEQKERFSPVSQEDGGGSAQYIKIKVSDLLTGKKEANPQILNGDVISVLEAQAIYVIGGVVNPKQVSFRSQITLSRAIASAGGLTKGADPKKITIFRREGGETKVIEADLEKIKTNPSEDITLQTSDIVEVMYKGRGEKRKYPPVISSVELNDKNAPKLPLRVIN
jgi:protein involved in polysaccharide export with SLBB domain